MTRDFAHSWRPHNSIRVKALGLHWRENRLLAARVFDDSGKLKGVRPLGGTIEFGETAQNALLREFHEELDLQDGPKLFPEGLKDRLLQGRASLTG
ncbi:NUDIX domain-containing protein [Shimia sp. R10_1]|uniref:NUDIX domain-containing protein n=1 Tax=Shimia sp. R10_1 TaxID=2821095 RepID=UPI001ADC8AEB|nr:NUDIX domain-containing protein [Shimia sp. R10_1]MBO9472400.1 NUDIX domain-containing protein [Shimia sp. R10_1]